jgi:hypothetical protein
MPVVAGDDEALERAAVQVAGAVVAPAKGEARPFAQLVADLGSAELAVREAASEAIAIDTDLTLEDLERALKDRGLSAEQVLRLSALAFPRFEAGPRGALGVSFGAVGVVQGVTPGFPAFGVLQANDRIIAVDGVPVMDDPQAAAFPGGFGGSSLGNIRPLIIAHDPGSAASLDVDRDGRRMNLRVTLGSFNDLGVGGSISPIEMTEAWRLRLGRIRPDLGPATPRPVFRPGPVAGDWDKRDTPGFFDAQLADQNAIAAAMTGLRPSVVAGGVPRGARPQAEAFAEREGRGFDGRGGNAVGGVWRRDGAGGGWIGGGVAGGGVIVNVGPGQPVVRQVIGPNGQFVGQGQMMQFVPPPQQVTPVEELLDAAAPAADRREMLSALQIMYLQQAARERLVQTQAGVGLERRQQATSVIIRLNSELAKIQRMKRELNQEGAAAKLQPPAGPGPGPVQWPVEGPAEKPVGQP